ncbi:hypothetical protein [Nonomuraea dietziae]|uniref:hypothetical protein n=1 Tax=Nonomuraea dietziae TaxID=65515 RepID=UPI0031DB5BA5
MTLTSVLRGVGRPWRLPAPPMLRYVARAGRHLRRCRSRLDARREPRRSCERLHVHVSCSPAPGRASLPPVDKTLYGGAVGPALGRRRRAILAAKMSKRPGDAYGRSSECTELSSDHLR